MIAAKTLKIAALIAVLVLALLVSQAASAHCDSLDGPVVNDARGALEQGDPAPILKWVRPEDEPGIRDAFRRTLAVRKKGAEARELADRYFFETLVRVHRAGEGEPYTGLKPAGSTDPGLAAADEALRAGSAAELAAHIGHAVAQGIERRHALALARRAHAADSVAAGRAWVEAYVDYAHFVEAVHRLATGDAPAAHHSSGGHAH